MRKGPILAAALVAATGAAPAAPAVSAPGLGGSSALGMRTAAPPGPVIRVAYNRSVARVQQALNDLGYAAGPVDGIMGPSTRAAIRSYQQDHGIAVDGQVSRELMRSLRTAHRDDEGGATADADAAQLVIDLQTELRRAGYAVPAVSGALDAATETAIRTYQADHDLLTTGQPSEQLLAHIHRSTEEDDPTDGMPRRELVQATQSALNALGYDAGATDGVMGSKTRTAIRTYQADAGLVVTGDASTDLLAHLGAAGGASGSATGAPERQVARLRDSFSDGQFTSDPRWQVLAGRFQVTDGALRSTIERPKPSETDDVQAVAREALEGVVSRALGVSIGEGDDVAAIATPVSMSNAFRIQARLGSSAGGGRFSIGPYQGGDARTGYRVQIAPEQEPAARILALGPDGAIRVVATSADRISIPGGATHAIDWRRERDGTMRLMIDGQTVITTSDRGFSKPFSGVVLVNGGGTWTVDDLAVDPPVG